MKNVITINDQELSIEQVREIVEGAPEGATHFVRSTYLKLIGAVWWQAWLQEWNHDANDMVRRWRGESIELIKTWGEVYELSDLRAILDSQPVTMCWDLSNGRDYSVGGEDIIDHVSPNCEVQNG